MHLQPAVAAVSKRGAIELDEHNYAFIMHNKFVKFQIRNKTTNRGESQRRIFVKYIYIYIIINIYIFF